MKISFKTKNILMTILYIIFLVIYFYTLTNFGMGSEESQIRYYMLFFLCVWGALMMFFNRKKIKWYSKSLLLIFLVGLVFLFMSYLTIKKLYISLDFRTYVQVFLVMAPAFLAFCMVNLYDTTSLVNLMKLTLIFTIIAYFTETNHTLLDFLDLDNWGSINFFSSTGSFTESSMCSEIFVQLFFFFFYFKNVIFKNKKNNLNFYMILSFIFVLLSFKRLGIVCCICLFFADRFIDFNKRVPKKRYIITAFVICLATIFYTKFMQGEIFNNIDVYKFSTGRDYILSLWESKRYFSYGYGTSMLVIGRYLEMDLIQIYLELGTLALFIFGYAYFYVANKNNYSYLIMLYTFLNMLTASSIPHPTSWIILFICIACITSNKFKDEELVYKDDAFKLRR